MEAKLTNRNFVGFDINPEAVELSRQKCDFQFDTTVTSVIDMADARRLPLGDESIDLIYTHPPYADIIHYSENIEEYRRRSFPLTHKRFLVRNG